MKDKKLSVEMQHGHLAWCAFKQIRLGSLQVLIDWSTAGVVLPRNE
jgi:hypothetical protein